MHLDGFLSYPSAVYTVPYGVMVPKEVDNLLLPVPVSGSHIGFSTLRMEPCWMAMGQAAGIASALSIDGEVAAQSQILHHAEVRTRVIHILEIHKRSFLVD